jgi:penicillin-binding protein 2
MLIAFFRVQILGHGKYKLQSETNRLRPIPLPAARGVVKDRNGLVIAENVPGYTVSLLPGPVDSLRARLWRIAPIMKLDSATIERVLVRYRRAPYQPALVHSDAPFEMVSALEERRLSIPGLVIQTEPKRYYPDGPSVAHVMGYVGEVTEQELAQERFATVRLGGLVGKDGLEREYDDTLRGADGVRFVEVSALGRMVREAGVAPALVPVAGTELHTTIDLELQRYIARIFPPGQRGAVIALKPSTGEILALYSAPGFDPNAFVGGVNPDYWRELSEGPSLPLFDRAIQARYPPGSTWKLAVAAMALKRGIASFRTHMPIPCRGGLQYGNRFFRCWKADGHGDPSLTDAIAQSCDVYFYQLGLRLGLTSHIEDVNEWQLRSRTGVDLPGEVPSLFPTGPEYYDRLYGARRWTTAVNLNLAIGQGENDQTLLSMVRFYQMLASDGRMRVPYVVRPANVDRLPAIDLPPEQLAGLRHAMLSVVEQGTARASRLRNLRLAGKTATSQNPHGRDHGWFIGFAPADGAEIVVGAVIEFAEHGSLVAPLVSRVIARYLGADTLAAIEIRNVLPADSAPTSGQILPEPAETTSDTLRDTVRDTVPQPRDTSRGGVPIPRR